MPFRVEKIDVIAWTDDLLSNESINVCFSGVIL